MASLVDGYFNLTSDHLLSDCTKDQRLRIAEHYNSEIRDEWLKGNIKVILKANLLEAGVLKRHAEITLAHLLHRA